MKKTLLVVAASGLMAAPFVGAQSVNPECNVGPNVPQAAQDACQKTIDLFSYMVPQLGVLITGGNAVLGQGGTLGGLGKISAGIRVNLLNASIPQVDEVIPSTGGARSDTYRTKAQILPGPTADVAIGLFRGLPLALTNVGGVDLLVSAAYVPQYTSDFVRVDVPQGSLKLGFGARVGALQESFVVPGVSISYLRRNLPTVTITGVTAPTGTGARDTLRIDTLGVHTSATRIVVSKHLLFFGLAVGAGRDTYNSAGTIRSAISPRAIFLPNGVRAGPVGLAQSISRTNVFADGSLNLPILKVIGEIGQVSGGTIATFNKFSGKQPADSRLFGSVGIRLSL